jgi:TfoX/Sxy family transcriptional regulator of competence genes
MSDLEARIRLVLTERGEVTIRRVLSGIGYFIEGSLAAAVIDDRLCVPVDMEDWEALLVEPGVGPLRFADRVIRGWLLVEPDAIVDDGALSTWIERGLGGD